MISDQELARLNLERKKRNLPLYSQEEIERIASAANVDETKVLGLLWGDIDMQHPTHPSMPGHERHEEWLTEIEEAKKREAEGNA